MKHNKWVIQRGNVYWKKCVLKENSLITFETCSAKNNDNDRLFEFLIFNSLIVFIYCVFYIRTKVVCFTNICN
jgi:hypothetical protein